MATLPMIFPEAATLIHIPADVSDDEAVKAALARISADCGGVDVPVNNAGFGISGAAEFTDTADALRLFDVNLFALLRCFR